MGCLDKCVYSGAGLPDCKLSLPDLCGRNKTLVRLEHKIFYLLVHAVGGQMLHTFVVGLGVTVRGCCSSARSVTDVASNTQMHRL